MDFIIKKISKVCQIFVRLLSKIQGILITIERNLTVHDEGVHTSEVIRSTQKYDMVSSSDEPYYKDQYWHWIKKYLDSEEVRIDGKYLDLGCGQGRLSLPLAQWCSGGRVTVVDFSNSALSSAKEYADKRNISNVDYHADDILRFLKSEKTDSFDAVLFLEVTLFMPEYEQVLLEIKRVLKMKGLLFVSFRSQYYYALHAINKRFWSDVATISKQRIGRLGGGLIQFTWQKRGEIIQQLNDLNFKILNICAIGCLSGIKGDPHSSIIRPSLLNEKEKEILMKLEIDLAESVPDAGRYMLCVAKKTHG